jgi:hypothetical protein
MIMCTRRNAVYRVEPKTLVVSNLIRAAYSYFNALDSLGRGKVFPDIDRARKDKSHRAFRKSRS